MDFKKIDKLMMKGSILYLVIPIYILLFFWFKIYISLPAIILLTVATYDAFKKLNNKNEEDLKKIFNKKKLIVLVCLIIGLNLLSGAGAIAYQNWDYNGRNAILNDLVTHDLPVKYDFSNSPYEQSVFGDSAYLNYYFAYWLPSALVGKVFGFTGASIFALIWQTIGVLLFFYLVCRKFNNIKVRYFMIFIAFGGLNILTNYLLGNNILAIGSEHIDTNTAPFCMSTFIVQLFWVFNQAVPAWIATMLLFQDRDYRTCGYYFAILVPFAPFPMLGFLYIAFAFIIFGKNLNRLLDLERFKSLFTMSNICGVLSILPVAFMFTLNTSRKGSFILDAINNGQIMHILHIYLVYVILEFFVYIIVVNKKNYKEIILYFLFFAIAPLFYIGGSDLGNRSTIPLLIGMYLLIVEYLDTFSIKSATKKQYILIGILLIAFVTNFNELFRSVEYTTYDYLTGRSNYANNYVTFDSFEGKEDSYFITNFLVSYDKDNWYFKYIVK